jgi:hypothetical protein
MELSLAVNTSLAALSRFGAFVLGLLEPLADIL